MTDQPRRVAAVSGATGYLGSRICDTLESNGWEVRRLVRRPDGADARSRRFDLGDPNPVSPDTLADVDLLIHAAYDLSLTDRADIWRINVEGTRRLLTAARAAGVPRIIVLSSMSAYAGTSQLYGRAKLEIEAITADLGGCSIRPGLVYGDRPGGMAGALRKITKLPIVPLPAGGARQYPLHEDDLMRVIAALAEVDPLPPGPIGVAPDRAVPFRDLLRGLAAGDGRRRPFVPVPWRLVYWGLRGAESARIPLPFRADSLLGLARPAPSVPGQDRLAALGVAIRPFPRAVSASTRPTGDADPGRPATATSERRVARVVVVGAGTRFLSAMSYYTLRVANALGEGHPVALIPMRQLLPTGLYPGARRVGTFTPALHPSANVTTIPGVDWYWMPSLLRAVLGLARWKPDVVVFQWWTGTVLHTYLALALVARLRGAAIIVEFHEILDTAEDRLPLARRYVGLIAPLFVGLASGFVIHSEVDRAPLDKRYRLGMRPVAVVPHGPSDHFVQRSLPGPEGAATARIAPAEAVNLLFFGLIRPFKGLEDLVEAFDGLADDEVGGYWLTVVGETWEGWDLPIERIAASRHRDRITLVNRWVDDDEVGAYFAAADAVVLPYHRSSASAPASVAMSHGLPLVITAVGGLPAAVADYDGAILVPPRDGRALRDAIRRLPSMRGRRYADPHSWAQTLAAYDRLIDDISTTR